MNFERLRKDEFENVFKTLKSLNVEKAKNNITIPLKASGKEIYSWFNDFAEMQNIIDDPNKIKVVNYKGENLTLLMFINKKEKELLKKDC